jgi:hypothetical protein
MGHPRFHHCWGCLARLLGGHRNRHPLIISFRGRPSFHHSKGHLACPQGHQLTACLHRGLQLPPLLGASCLAPGRPGVPPSSHLALYVAAQHRAIIAASGRPWGASLSHRSSWQAAQQQLLQLEMLQRYHFSHVLRAIMVPMSTDR